MYNKDFLQEMKTILIAKEKKLENELSRIASKNTRVKDDYKTRFPEYGNQIEDNAMEVSEYANNLPIEQRIELDLKAVKAALDKIEDGTYGQCSNCQKMIEEKRLRVMPEATTCMSCNK